MCIRDREQVANGKDAGPAEAALGSNAQQLANVFSAVYSDQDAATFLGQWRAHDGSYVDYAAAKADSDASKTAAASAKLDDFSTAVGNFLSQVTKGGLNASTATSDFRAQVESILAVVDAAAGHSGDEVALIRTAASHTTGTGALISEAIAEQFPAKYLP